MNKLGTTSLVMITLCAILNLRGMPIMATEGASAIVYYLIGAIGFLIPSTVCCSALAKQNPSAGGVFLWVSNAFGNKAGFVAIWMEWINNLVAVPASLTTLIASLAYAGLGNLSANHTVLFFTMVLIYLLITWLNVCGIRFSSKLSVIGALIGTLIPAALMMVLAAIWMVKHPTHIHLHNTALSFNNAAILVSVISGFSGMQITAFHIQDTKDPTKSIPKALLIACGIILFISIFTTMSISLVLSPSQIQLSNGVIESFDAYFHQFHLGALTHILAVCITMGMLGSMSAWVIGPARGLLQSAKVLELPNLLTATNKYDIPISILAIQALIAIGLMSIYLFTPSIKTAFWLLILITSQFTLLMYCFVFASAIRLIPQKTIQLFGIIGFITLILALTYSFKPPTFLHLRNMGSYIGFISITDLLIIGLPVILLVIIETKND